MLEKAGDELEVCVGLMCVFICSAQVSRMSGPVGRPWLPSYRKKRHGICVVSLSSHPTNKKQKSDIQIKNKED